MEQGFCDSKYENGLPSRWREALSDLTFSRTRRELLFLKEQFRPETHGIPSSPSVYIVHQKQDLVMCPSGGHFHSEQIPTLKFE